MIDKLDSDTETNAEEILEDLENYHPPCKGWTWRIVSEGGVDMAGFYFRNMPESLKNSVPMPTAKYFKGIDPQPAPVVTSEIASGHFEDDIRRMRTATWNGANHVMVICTAGQDHTDGLMEGTPEGIGGVPITHKQLRANRKACGLVEDRVGRPVNFHSYISGVAGPEITVLFAEEGVNDAHQDLQYNVLYHNTNAYRSYVDAGEVEKITTGARIFQIDGAHNASAIARQGWKVMPEPMVQHGLDSAFSVMVGTPKDLVGLSTVSPNAPPTPRLWFDLPHAVALRDLFPEYEMCVQQNARYIESDINEATHLHVIGMMISMLISADIQNTITPDEGHNLPWHYNSMRGVQTVKQTWATLDGVKEPFILNWEGLLGGMVCDLKERAIGSLTEMLHAGGYPAAVEQGFFVDSAELPERNHDGIARDGDGGISVGTVTERDPDYLTPACDHFGNNNLPAGVDKTRDLVGGCTLCDLEKTVYIDELDLEDSAYKRLERTREYRSGNLLRPETGWAGDGVALVELMIPEWAETIVEMAPEMAKRMRLSDPRVANLQVLQLAEGCFVEVRGYVGFDVDRTELTIPEKIEPLPGEKLRQLVTDHEITVMAGAAGKDEHSVGMREILDIKHSDLEKYGVRYHYPGTPVSVEKMVNAAIEPGSDATLISTVISRNEVHRTMMKKLAELIKERDIRDEKMLIAGGTQVSRNMAAEIGLDATFDHGTKGIDMLDVIVRTMRGCEQEKVG